MAMVRGKRFWRIQPSEIEEIDTFKDAGAELINTYVPKESLERAKASSAAVAVTLGMGSLLYTRIDKEREDARRKNAEALARRAAREAEQQTEATPVPESEPTPITRPVSNRPNETEAPDNTFRVFGD